MAKKNDDTTTDATTTNTTGYQGEDAEDTGTVDTSGPAYGGVGLENPTQEVPGGHPSDPTTSSSVGSAGK